MTHRLELRRGLFLSFFLSDTPHYENVPFEVPKSWVWCKLEDIVCELKYGTSEKSSSVGKIAVLRMGNITNVGTIDYSNLVYSSNDEDIEQYSLEKYDLLFNRTNSSEWVGKTAIYKDEQPAIYAGYLIRIRPLLISPDYLNTVMNSGYYREWCYNVKTDAVNQSNINAKKLSQLMIPIPPLREQGRIVAEIDKWISLIDIVKNGKGDLQTVIKQAKSKILDLAIHGKLVPQDPNDEPAIELLKRINPDFTPCDNGHYTQLPEGWQIAPMQTLCKLTDGEKQTGIERIYLDVKYLRGEREAKTMISGKFVAANALLILVDGENSGEVFQTPIDGYQGSTFKQLLINGNMNEEYVLLVINMHRKILRESKVGSAIPHLNKKLFKAIEVPIPPYHQQKRIVEAINIMFKHLDIIMESL
ncbi:restriction endonuclease subunit S [Odoribacter splanchnicus]|uniref:Restriction endonuclease subunit S n=1 Tax=Odoribacter splanchnicus TaxID=28118 RepID=A0AAW5C4M0_9BACT|nr:restriction endonuclease subunit S [Odoribacter splanchnicus]MBV4401012.1 restriction endonuclease subunit S [Odoribacter splanchnicus]MBV4409689.1 restriction endonuclease subunit S [Odoribacter splanchnicus]MCG4959954.1 restriction endonuclease subunit S [Odoribacter splanchnicus]MCG5003115.1 restriction endonuclease subunit S [Odoribacter splanchnicus]